MIAAIYARKSTDSEAGVERQAAIAADFIRAKGWTVGPVFSDNDVSGGVFDRPGLNALLAAVASSPRPFDRIVMMDASRLGGDMAETLPLQIRLTKAVKIFHYQDGQELLLSTPVQKLTASIANFSNEDYKYQAQIKTKSALRKKAEQGHACGARTFGYRTVRVAVGTKDEHAERVLVPEQAAVVRRIFELAASGMGDRRIAGLLNAEHVPAPGKEWGKCEVSRALSNELYRGVAVYGKRGAAPETWIRKELPELRIVTDELWQRVRARKEQTARAYARDAQGHLLSKPETGLSSRYLLVGFARCWSCGGSLNVMRKPGERERYFCSRRYSRPGSCANGRGVPMLELDASVRAVIRARLGDTPEVVRELIAERDARWRAATATQVDRRAEAAAEVAQLEQEIGRMLGYMKAGTASADVVEEIARLRATVEALKANPAPPPRLDPVAVEHRFTVARQIGNMVYEDPAQARAALRKLGVDRIVVNRTGDTWSFDGTMQIPIGEREGLPDNPLVWNLEGGSRRSVRNGYSGVSSEPTGSP